MAAAGAVSSTDFIHSLVPYPQELTDCRECLYATMTRLTAGRQDTPTVQTVRNLAAEWFDLIPKEVEIDSACQAVAHRFHANMWFLQQRGIAPFPTIVELMRQHLIEEKAYDSNMSVQAVGDATVNEEISRQSMDALCAKELKKMRDNVCPKVVGELQKLPDDHWIPALHSLGVMECCYEAKETDPWQVRLAPLMIAAACLLPLEMAKAFELNPIAWKRSHSFENLASELEANGPIIVFGAFGPLHHRSAPVKFRNEIWGWVKTEEELAASSRSSPETRKWGIIITGASKEKQRLFYREPMDGRVYALSFAAFLDRMIPCTVFVYSEVNDDLNVFGYQDSMWGQRGGSK